MVGPDEARQLDLGPSVRQPQHDDLGARVRDAADGVEELALDEATPLDLEAQRDEERRGPVEVGDGDPDMVETLDL